MAQTSHRVRRYRFRLSVRVTAEERQQIVSHAQYAKLSTSRYLARLATQERPPPTAEERKRLESLLLLFRRGEEKMRRLAHEVSLLPLPEGKEATVAEIRETAALLSALVSQIGKRL